MREIKTTCWCIGDTLLPVEAGSNRLRLPVGKLSGHQPGDITPEPGGGKANTRYAVHQEKLF